MHLDIMLVSDDNLLCIVMFEYCLLNLSCMHFLNLFVIPDYLDTDAEMYFHIIYSFYIITVVYSVDGFLDIYNKNISHTI